MADDYKKSHDTNSARQQSEAGGAAEHLIDGSKKRTCRLSFEFQSAHVIESCSKTYRHVLTSSQNMVTPTQPISVQHFGALYSINCQTM